MNSLIISGAALIALAIAATALKGAGKRRKDTCPKSAPDETRTDGARIDPERDPAPAAVHEAPPAQTDARSVYLSKASTILKLLNAVEETEGIREVTMNEIKNLESQIAAIKKNLEGEETKYDLKEAGVRMTYAHSRIEWIIKSYPRLRNDSNTSALKSEIRKLDRKIDNLKEEV